MRIDIQQKVLKVLVEIAMIPTYIVWGIVMGFILAFLKIKTEINNHILRKKMGA